MDLFALAPLVLYGQMNDAAGQLRQRPKSFSSHPKPIASFLLRVQRGKFSGAGVELYLAVKWQRGRHFSGQLRVGRLRRTAHGGIIAALLDGAMANCMFARGLAGLTVELKVRYHASVVAAETVSIRAWLEDDSHGLYQLRAELVQGGAVKAGATGKFMKRT